MNADEPPILIIGAGLAGLFLALKLAPRRVILASPSPLGTTSSSAWAQGGLAAALDPEDSPQDHANDTQLAGAGLTDPNIALMLAKEGPDRVRDLLALGVPFDRTESGALALSLEAAHSRPRVARVAGDLAGKAIIDALTHAVLAADHIEIFQPARAVSLVQSTGGDIVGAVFQTDRNGATQTVLSGHTVMSTGGIGGLFEVTTNPRSSLGDGIGMAARCGALLADLEFIQYHPTAMDFGADPAPLATEALRGEGARLIDARGKHFMAAYHPDAELAPRDIVARAIANQHREGLGAFLDAREAIGADFPHEFPTVYNACQLHGLNPIEQPIPVVPAVHYHMGGIVCDIWGQTTLEGLSVAGECASTGAHGANRLASNSLLEAIVFAHRIALALKDKPLKLQSASAVELPVSCSPETLTALRKLMAKHCGVIRDEAGLNALLVGIDMLADGGSSASYPTLVAKCIAGSALNRRESRGAHFRVDYPDSVTARRSFLANS